MAGTVAQTQLDGLEELIERDSIDGEDIDSIEIDTYKRAKIIMGGTGKEGESGNRHIVDNREQADHSLPYTMAALALDGELGHEQYKLERIRSDDVQDLLKRVTITEDPELTDRYENGEMPAVVRVTTSDGTVHEIENRTSRDIRPVRCRGTSSRRNSRRWPVTSIPPTSSGGSSTRFATSKITTSATSSKRS